MKGLLGAALLLSGGCLAKDWQAGPNTLVTDTQIAEALGERTEAAEPFDPSALAQVTAPERVRPCCALGMDLKVKVGASPCRGIRKATSSARRTSDDTSTTTAR